MQGSLRTVQISPYVFVQGVVCNVEAHKEDECGKRRYYATVKVNGNVITGEIFPASVGNMTLTEHLDYLMKV